MEEPHFIPFSIVVPVYREEKNVAEFLRRVVPILELLLFVLELFLDIV
jgi:hypothetical protein